MIGDGLEHSAEDLYENAPCGYLSTDMDGRILKVNATLRHWLHFEGDALLGRRFTDLLTVGGRIHYETHFGPILLMEGELSGVTVDIVTADGSRVPVMVTSVVKSDADGRAVLVRTTLVDASDRRAYEQELLRAQQDAERERARVQVLATTLQRSLLPPPLSPPPGMEVSASYHHASQDDVGGDFYDLFPLTDGRWAFFLGDVCGKGAPAAAVTSLTRYTLRSAAVYDRDPISVLHHLDAVLRHENDHDDPRFCTVLFGILEKVEDGYAVEMAGGGHPPALLLTADGSADYRGTLGGQLVGILPDAHFVSTTVHLAPGDTFVLYTDGLTEARTGVGRKRYDDDGALLEFGKQHSPATATTITDAIGALLAGLGDGVQDDVAILALSIPKNARPIR